MEATLPFSHAVSCLLAQLTLHILTLTMAIVVVFDKLADVQKR